MRHHTTNLIIVLGLAVISLLVIGQYHEAGTTAATEKRLDVQQTCDNARQGIAPMSDCYNVETETNSEYLCRVSGDSTNCWVEVK